mgnify:CR=1 FL=1
MKVDDIKRLREETGAGIMDCRKAIEESKGNFEKAKELLFKRGLAKAEKKAERVTKEGIIDAYIHLGGRIGALIEVNCETDFVARTDEFRNLVKELLLQITAMAPKFISRDDVPEDILKEEKEKIKKETGIENEEKIEEYMEKFYSEKCLLEQPFIKNETIKVKDLISTVIAKTGENIKVRRFARFELSE